MSYQINIFSSARKEIRELPDYVRAQALQLIDQLAENPRPSRAKELRDKPNIHRLWLAGQWRLFTKLMMSLTKSISYECAVKSK